MSKCKVICRIVQIDWASLRGFPMVVAQHSTEPITVLNDPLSECNHIRGRDQSISHALMIPFGVIMSHVFFECPTQRGLAEGDHAID